MKTVKEIIACAIANTRGARNGVPFIENVLDILPYKLKQEVCEDAETILSELKKQGYEILKVHK